VYKGMFENEAVAIKVLLNVVAGYQTVDIADEFRLEFALIADPERLPWHPNIIRALHMFVDKAAGVLPGWNFDPEDVQSKTQIVILPLLETDLKQHLKRLPAGGMGDAQLSELAEQLLKAVVHLHEHRIVHRDIKADNVMIRTRQSDGAMEFLLIDFGCALDCQAYELDEFKMPYLVPTSKGGAPGFLAPEVALAKAGRGKFIDYSGADAFTCGMLLHGAMCAGADQPPSGPFAPQEEPGRFVDAEYRVPPNGSPALKEVVRELLYTGMDARLSAAAALARVAIMNTERRVREMADREWERQRPMNEENEGKGDDGDDDMMTYGAAVPLSPFSLAIAAQIDAEEPKDVDMDFALMGKLKQVELPAARALDIAAYKTQVACTARKADVDAQLVVAMAAENYERCAVLQGEAKEAAAQLEAATDARAKEWAQGGHKIIYVEGAQEWHDRKLSHEEYDRRVAQKAQDKRRRRVEKHQRQMADENEGKGDAGDDRAAPPSPFSLAITAQIRAEEAKGVNMNFALMGQLKKVDLPAARALDIAAHQVQVGCVARKAEVDAQLVEAIEAEDYEQCGVLQGEAKEAAAQLEAATDTRVKEWAASKWLVQYNSFYAY
jgi:serine/threonine protein kinase